MSSNTGPFENIFDFSRSRVAPYRDDTGAVVDAAIDEPRLDHDALGNPIGLLIEGNPDTIQVDTCRIVSSEVQVNVAATILHELINHNGEHKQVAILTPDGRTTLNARLALRGHHVRLAHFVGYRPVIDGFVRWANELWQVPAELDIGDGNFLMSGDDYLTGAI